MNDVKTEASALGPPSQKKETEPRETGTIESGVPPSGRRAAFRDVRRQLTDEELFSPGVQKLILGLLEEADDEREYLRSYINLYHESDKKAAVLSEKLLTQKAIEIFFGVGVGLGGAIIGLMPFFWGEKSEYGVIAGIVGLCIIVGASVGRIVKR
ncbi:MAG: hypothetical protein HZA77_10300 [Candidatus Schekmanbacteria bacterium]|nr:hypothetical protein [Candidatus Schekmanbacteria bacterium]